MYFDQWKFHHVSNLDEWWYRNKKYDRPGYDLSGDLDPGTTAKRNKRRDTRRQDKRDLKGSSCRVPTELDVPIADDPKEKEPQPKRAKRKRKRMPKPKALKCPVRSQSTEMG